MPLKYEPSKRDERIRDRERPSKFKEPNYDWVEMDGHGSVFMELPRKPYTTGEPKLSKAEKKKAKRYSKALRVRINKAKFDAQYDELGRLWEPRE
jgi:hypothetical protein